jgi:hypothetical protein
MEITIRTYGIEHCYVLKSRRFKIYCYNNKALVMTGKPFPVLHSGPRAICSATVLFLTAGTVATLFTL